MAKDFKYFYKLYDDARSYENNRFSEYQELMAYYEGKQELLATYATEKPWVIDINTPYATNAINLRISSLLSNDYVGEIQPLSPFDVDKVFILNQAYQNMWNELNMDKHVDESILRCAIIREAYTHIIYNDDAIVGGTMTQRKGKLEAYFIDPRSVLIDPKATSLDNAEYVIITERISREQAKEQFRKYKDEEMGGVGLFDDLESYASYIGNMNDDDNVLTKMTVYEIRGNRTRNKRILKSITVNNQVVLNQEELPINVLPIAQLRWEKKMKSPYGISLMDRLLPLQKSVNAIESAYTNTVLAYAVPSFVVSKDSGLDPMDVARTAGAPGIVLPVDGDPRTAIVPLMQGKVIDEQMVVVKREHQMMIEQIAGVTDQFMGELGTAGNTTGGAQQAVARAKIIEQQFMVNLEDYIEQLTGIVVEFIIKVFKGEKLYTRGQQQANGKFQFNELQIPVAEDIEYEFYVNLNIRTPFNKQNNQNLMMQMYQFERQYDAPVKVITALDVLKTFDVPNRDELTKRYQDMTTQTNQKKAEVITMLIAKSAMFGIPQATLEQAVAELIAGGDTPTLDSLMQQMQQLMQQQQQLQQKQNEAMVRAQMAQTRADNIQGQMGQEGVPMPEQAATGEVTPAQLEGMM